MQIGKEILSTVVREYVSLWQASQLAGSYWDVVATALGEPRFVAHTVASLTPEKLDRYPQAHFRSALHVQMAVEGLAALDSGELQRCATAWPAPEQVNDACWWWQAAWSSAMRHLKASGTITLDAFLSTPTPALMFQALALWEDPDLVRDDSPGTRTVEEAVEMLLPTLQGQRQKLPIPPDPYALLRRLRGHENLLDAETCQGIAGLIETWTDAPDKPNIYLPVLLDLGRSICPAIVDDARVSLAERLPFCSSLGDWYEECLILLTDWQLP